MEDESVIDSRVAQYVAELSDLETVGNLYKNFLENHLSDLKVQSLSMKVKKPESFRAKLKKSRNNAWRITDAIGLRVITYFTEDLDRVSNRIFESLEIDYDNSVNKTSSHNLESFGYNSVHWIAKFKEHELRQPGYSICRKYPVEIQLRTVMQHAWAEIEHDIGYKSKHTVPSTIRRKFARLSGLIEIVDDGFSDILAESKEMSKAPLDELEFSVDELKIFIATDNTVQELKEAIKKDKGVFFIEFGGDPNTHYLSSFIANGFHDLSSLKQALNRYRREIIETARSNLPAPGSVRRPHALPLGYPLNVLFEVLL